MHPLFVNSRQTRDPVVQMTHQIHAKSFLHRFVTLKVTKKWKKDFVLRLNSVDHCSNVLSWLHLLSRVSKRGSHSLDSSFVSNYWDWLCLPRSLKIPTISAISHTFICRCANTRWWTIVTLSFIVVLFKAIGYGSTKAEGWPCWNPINQVLMGAIEGEELRYTAPKCSSFSLLDFASKNVMRNAHP